MTKNQTLALKQVLVFVEFLKSRFQPVVHGIFDFSLKHLVLGQHTSYVACVLLSMFFPLFLC